VLAAEWQLVQDAGSRQRYVDFARRLVMPRLVFLSLVAAFAPLTGAAVPVQPKNPPKTFTNSLGMQFVWIPPGTFLMGSPKEEQYRRGDETQHKVTLTKGF
jgi:formylglycine-generating enzyme required for sulfatase activity